jgi:hypothetical protein
MAEWSKDHAAAIGSLKLNDWCKCWNLVKMETGRGPRGKGRQLVEKVGEWVCGKLALSRLYPSPVSVKDLSVGPHEQILNVPIACR